MKASGFLQDNRLIADFFVQQSSGLNLESAPHSPPQAFKYRTVSKDVRTWNGLERRNVERREEDRRNERQMAMLDTRTNQDRRRQGRRESDLHLHSFSFRA